jgi:O-antigen ligase
VSGAAGNSLVWRFGYWRQALDLNNDPLLGNGLRSVRETTDIAKEPHNDFIRVFVETGAIGLLAYLWLVVTLWRTGKRAIRNTAEGTLFHGVTVGFFGCVVAFLLLSFVSNVITQLVIFWYFAAFAAAAVAAPRLAPADERDPDLALTR